MASAEFFADDVTMSFLPMAHSAERNLSFYGRVSTGVATAYASSMSTLLDELREVGPTVFGSVPRIFEKAYGTKSSTEVEREARAAPSSIFAWARRVSGERLRTDDSPDSRCPSCLELQHQLADRSAVAQDPRLLRRSSALLRRRCRPNSQGCPGLLLGRRNASPRGLRHDRGHRRHSRQLASVRQDWHRRQAPAGLEQRIADDGEILVRGPWVFKGYYRNPEATAATVIDGWLHTGDVGSLDEEGYLRITDRKKHLIITAGGKNLSPGNIEAALKSADPLISHVIAHGDRRQFVSALIAPSPLETLDWGLARGLVSADEVAARQRELFENPTARSEALARRHGADCPQS
jgi:long-chain acyl-CoA synthetase